MITPELISRYHFFEDMDIDQLKALANIAEGVTFEEKKFVFRKGDRLKSFYIVIEGALAIVRETEGKPDAIISAIGPGHTFAFSSLVPPYLATASAKTLSPCWLISFDCEKLQVLFKENCQLGYKMMGKIVQICRDRLLDARIESLVFLA